jgi:hypothetical protein
MHLWNALGSHGLDLALSFAERELLCAIRVVIV